MGIFQTNLPDQSSSRVVELVLAIRYAKDKYNLQRTVGDKAGEARTGQRSQFHKSSCRGTTTYVRVARAK
jgi:hypothetical protein